MSASLSDAPRIAHDLIFVPHRASWRPRWSRAIPEELQLHFRGMLQMQQYLPIVGDHNFTIDQKF